MTVRLMSLHIRTASVNNYEFILGIGQQKNRPEGGPSMKDAAVVTDTSRQQHGEARPANRGSQPGLSADGKVQSGKSALRYFQ